MVEIVPNFIGPIYFRFISKNWIYLQIVGVSLSAISAVLIWFLPESPRFLYVKHRYQEAREALSEYEVKIDQAIDGVKIAFREFMESFEEKNLPPPHKEMTVFSQVMVV